jgi:hypothetical protein
MKFLLLFAIFDHRLFNNYKNITSNKISSRKTTYIPINRVIQLYSRLTTQELITSIHESFQCNVVLISRCMDITITF